MSTDRRPKRFRNRTYERHLSVPFHELAVDEPTPPPQEPPKPEDLANLDIHEQLAALASSVGELRGATVRLWNERGNSDRLDKLEGAVIGYTAQVARQQENLDAFLNPSVKALMAAAETAGRAQVRVDALLARNEELLKSIDGTLRDVVTRIGRLELTVERLHTSYSALTEQVKQAEAELAELDRRVTEQLEQLERRTEQLEQRNKLSDAASTAIATDRKKWLSWGKAGAGAVVAVATAIVTNLDDLVRWLT